MEVCLSQHYRDTRYHWLLPDGVFLQQPLDGHGELPQETLDDGPTLGELVLHVDLQDVSGQGHEGEPLQGEERVSHTI